MIMPTRNPHPSPTAPPRSIEVVDIARGTVPGVVAIVAVRVGGLLFRHVVVNDRGRGLFVTFPSRKVAGHWVDLVEIVSPALHTAVVEVILATVRTMGGER
jgi:DNA-binding cell septation regulator SpoVG